MTEIEARIGKLGKDFDEKYNMNYLYFVMVIGSLGGFLFGYDMAVIAGV